MRVYDRSDRGVKAPLASVKRSGSATANTVTEIPKVAIAPSDQASFLGIPQAELTPPVRSAIDKLLTEVQGLRNQLAGARKRIVHLEELADRDALTPVMNRRAFVRELARMIAFAERYDVPGSVIFFDVDRLKRINDAYGHAAGDAVLRRVAEVLLGKLRGSDVVGRLGGDEFGVILPQADKHAAATKAAALTGAISAEMVAWEGARLEVSVSYGVYTFAGGEEVHEALHAADQAMYAQKHQAPVQTRHV